MLTEDNYKNYVGWQPFTGPVGLAFMLGIQYNDPDSWVNNIRKMTTDQVLDKLLSNENEMMSLSLNINKYAVECNMTLSEMLEEANKIVQTFPRTPRPESYAINRVAFNSRRGAANRKLGDNIVLYKGTSGEFDCFMVVAQFGDRYGIVKQPNYEKYGMIFNDGTKV